MTNEELILLIRDGVDPVENTSKLYDQVERLISKVANTHASTQEDFEDLQQEGYISFVKAVERYTPDCGANFATYLFLLLRRDFKRYLNKTESVKLSDKLKEELYNYRKFKDDYLMQFGCDPTDWELMTGLNISRSKLRSIKEASILDKCISLDKPMDFDDSGSCTLGDTVKDSADQIGELIDDIANKQAEQIIRQSMEILSEQEKKTLYLYFKCDLTLAEISKELGVSAGRTQQIKETALKKLRKGKNSEILKKLAFDVYGCGIKRVGYRYYMHSWSSSTEDTALKELTFLGEI